MYKVWMRLPGERGTAGQWGYLAGTRMVSDTAAAAEPTAAKERKKYPAMEVIVSEDKPKD